MILAALLALAMAASDSTQTPTDSGGINPPPPSHSHRPITDGIGEDVFNPTPAWRSSFQNYSGPSQTLGATPPLVILGLAGGVALMVPTIKLLGGGGEACGLGCMGNPGTLLMAIGGGLGVLVGLPYLGYKIGQSIDAKAQTTREGLGIRFAFALDPILQKFQRRALWRAP